MGGVSENRSEADRVGAVWRCLDHEWIRPHKVKEIYWIDPRRFGRKGSRIHSLYTALSPAEKVRLVDLLTEKAVTATKIKSRTAAPEITSSAICCLLECLMRDPLDLTVEQIYELFAFYRRSDRDVYEHASFISWPLVETARQVKHLKERKPLNRTECKVIQDLAGWPEFEIGWDDNVGFISDQHEARCHLIEALETDPAQRVGLPEIRVLPSLRLGSRIHEDLTALSPKDRDRWLGYMHDALRVAVPNPTRAAVDANAAWVDVIGADRYRKAAHRWLEHAASLEDTDPRSFWELNHAGRIYLPDPDERVALALVLGLERFSDSKTLKALARFTERCFAKVPGVGAAALSLGNACVRQLAAKRGLGGITHLSRLKLRVPQANSKAFIQRRLEEVAEKRGLTAREIEETAAPDFGLENGQRDFPVGDYTFRISVGPTGKVTTSWFTADGAQQKSVPKAVKSSARLRDRHEVAKEIAKQIRQNWSVQRDRIDRLFLEDASWPIDRHRTLYLDHGLVGAIARSLIWVLSDNDSGGISARWSEGKWLDVDNQPITPANNASVSLWHPVGETADAVSSWRHRLEAEDIRQPLKQSYREVYLLTDAERETRCYSNRMAAHLLRQHQFNRLAQGRGWQNRLLLWFDSVDEGGLAKRRLAAHDLVAEFWIAEVEFDGQSYTDNGVWTYVATDQLRFYRASDAAGEPSPLELESIPPLVFSEIMRDLDLFVGVASVGNDPTWVQREGSLVYYDYWTNYSFGDLSEIAKTRREILEKILPRLKIRDRAHIDGNFLIVDGNRHTYKIHIGSTNILIAPDEKYLCIVPDQHRQHSSDRIALPFEGDGHLSSLLSKAFLLADDDKIADKTILSQL